MTTKALRPTMWMSDIYGPNHIYAPRAPDAASDYMPRGAYALDTLTGGQLVIAGAMPVVCSAGFATPAAEDLLGLAGLSLPQKLFGFRTGEASEVLAQAASDPAVKLVYQHAFPPDAPETERCWIGPALLPWVNRKDNLGALAPAEHVPERHVVERASFAARPPQLPFVVKAVTDQSNGGGYAVVICRTEGDVRQAVVRFADCEQLVVETMLDIVRNPCLTYAVTAAGDVSYFGFADQELTAEGKHVGNWIDPDAPLDEAVVAPATETMRRAAAMGYYGLAGVDVAVTRDGKVYVLDLNFRCNASTAAVLLWPRIVERLGPRVAHFRRVTTPLGATALVASLQPLVSRGAIIPISLFDPDAAGYPGSPAMAQVLLLGPGREEVAELEEQLARGLAAM